MFWSLSSGSEIRLPTHPASAPRIACARARKGGKGRPEEGAAPGELAGGWGKVVGDDGGCADGAADEALPHALHLLHVQFHRPPRHPLHRALQRLAVQHVPEADEERRHRVQVHAVVESLPRHPSAPRGARRASRAGTCWRMPRARSSRLLTVEQSWPKSASKAASSMSRRS
eukprot:3276492-Rhodomonas_salina.1